MRPQTVRLSRTSVAAEECSGTYRLISTLCDVGHTELGQSAFRFTLPSGVASP